MSRLTIIIIIFLIASLFLGVIFVWPEHKTLQVIRLDIEQRQSELSSKSEYYSQIKSIFAELDAYQAQLSKISSAIPEELSLPGLFNYLQQTSTQTGLVLEDITFFTGGKTLEEPEKKEGLRMIKKINIGLELSGSYSSLKEFLSAIEKSARLFEVKMINFSSPKELEEPFSFKLEITTNSY